LEDGAQTVLRFSRYVSQNEKSSLILRNFSIAAVILYGAQLSVPQNDVERMDDTGDVSQKC
jgi:hypothetical protein